MAAITPVLLCGGVGSRLWPVSRQGRPKQYLNLIGDTSMILFALMMSMDVDHCSNSEVRRSRS
ncbi:MAG: hypothetical protein CNE43_05580 [Halieaceae bacterium MED-G26]|nr:MAG: hypothetical protein CNE43_05580 [Halieaceae bacterium MED-G26]